MIVTYENYALAQDVYTEFSLKQHSKHMATLSALGCLAQLISEIKPKKVVELGGGIGTITELMLRHSNQPHLCLTLEDNPICLPALRERIGGFFAVPASFTEHEGCRFRIVTNPQHLRGKAADLLIVDGYCKTDDELSVIRDGTTIFFEGNRGPERAAVMEYVFAQGMHVTFGEEKVEVRGQPMEGKGCWIGKVVTL